MDFELELDLLEKAEVKTIYADRDISSLTDVPYHGYHLLSSHHKIQDGLARKELQCIVVCQRKVGPDYSTRDISPFV